ncbi:uncharacterized protein LOC129688422 [Psammomys obesus]|uniref:uncharacterized protein LOC129688422 n=1 Tax=Psammomys obesus TaxID=48139 RepID=UPI002452F28A|nr:uncharacterized protein LOC129688422 [Psammomys obesus]
MANLLGASRTLKFFFSEAVMGQHFQEVELEKGEPQPGDLFLFKLQSPRAQWCGAHVGVYCGHGEIIHFEGRTSGDQGLQTLLGFCEGVVCKQGHRALQRSRRLWRVLRRRGGVDLRVLEHRVQEAMNGDPPPYHPTSSNCVHFALNLLGMDTEADNASLLEGWLPSEGFRLCEKGGLKGTIPKSLRPVVQPTPASMAFFPRPTLFPRCRVGGPLKSLHSAGGAGAFKNLSAGP